MRRYMSVNNKYKPGEFSKGYRVTKKGFDSYMANSFKKLKKESLEEPQGYPNATLEESINGKALQAIELSSEFTTLAIPAISTNKIIPPKKRAVSVPKTDAKNVRKKFIGAIFFTNIR